MPSSTAVIILATAGALCLALAAAGTRRLLGGWRWTGIQPEEDPKVWRRAVLRMLCSRFGDLPPAVIARIESADQEWCEEIAARAATVDSLEEPGL